MSDASWKICGASVQGTAHREHGLPCQDAHAFRLLDDGRVVVAVADGAGSAELAEVAAALCVQTALRQLETIPDAPLDNPNNWMRSVFAQVHAALEACANTREVALRKLAATLTVAVLTDAGVAQGAVGDSGAVFCFPDGSLRTLCQPYKGEYANETSFISDPQWENHFQVDHTVGITAFLLATDGLLDVILRGGRIDEAIVRPLLEFAAGMKAQKDAAANLADFLQSPRITRRVDDDVTLVLGSLAVPPP